MDGDIEVQAPPVLSVRDATKAFGAVHALGAVSLDLYGGEVHALVGENGAGKSTLVKLLGGVHQPDAGTLVDADGAPLVLTGPADARAAGIAIIYQEPTLFPDLSVAENVFIPHHPLARGAAHRPPRDEAPARASCSPASASRSTRARIARGLSIAEQQLVEIAKALSLEARVVVMDEPTAALSAAEVARLFGVAESLREHGAGGRRSSRTASRRSSPCASASRCCATGGACCHSRSAS